jgi:hypothetical protein
MRRGDRKSSSVSRENSDSGKRDLASISRAPSEPEGPQFVDLRVCARAPIAADPLLKLSAQPFVIAGDPTD